MAFAWTLRLKAKNPDQALQEYAKLRNLLPTTLSRTFRWLAP